MSNDAAPPGPEPKKRKRRRKRSRPPGGPTAPEAPRADVESRLARIVGELDRVVAALVHDLDGAGRGVPVKVELAVPLELGTTAGPVAARAAALGQALRTRVSEAVRGTSAFREGHVYCFYTDQPESPYSRPPGPTDVFAGYAVNGKPEWVGFANLCLQRKEPRVDRLWADPPEIAAVVQMHDELAQGMLPEFGLGSRAYRLLGQVAFGFVPRSLDPRTRGTDRVALTLQIVATTLGTSASRLRLNVLGMSAAEIAEAAAASDAASAAEAFRKVLRGMRDRVDALGRKAALAAKSGQAMDLDPEVRAVLGRLRGDVLRVFKSRDYRTRHAEERHQSGERPTSLAISDALGAGDGRFYRDERKDTVVVAGPKHRVHVFSREGRHVTSLDVLPGELERRVERGRWQPLEKLASELFKDSLRRAREA